MILAFDQRECCVCFLALELAPGAPQLNSTLPRAAAEELGALIAAELSRLCPGIETLGLVFVGALFEPEELLKPGLRWAQWLNDQYRLAAGTSSASQLLFFGERDGRMPIRELEPDARRASGVLKLMPILLRGEAAQLAPIAERLEAQLTEIGIAGPPLMQCVQGWCGQQVAHGCYMTLLDVLAFERAQLEQAQLSVVADLLEIVFLSPTRPESVRQAPGIQWTWTGQDAEARFLGERAWCEQTALPAAQYLDYVRLQRQIAAGLDAFGIPRSWLDENLNEISYVLEKCAEATPDQALGSHSDEALGLVCLSGVWRTERYTYWPLEPSAVPAIRAHFLALS